MIKRKGVSIATPLSFNYLLVLTNLLRKENTACILKNKG